LKEQLTKKQWAEIWLEFKESILNSATVDTSETSDQKKARITRLEKHPEEWFKYYFGEDSSSEPAAFHKAATRRIINNPEWYEVRHWARSFAKSTRSMMEDLFLMLVGHPVVINGKPAREKKRFKIIISSSYDAAEKLFMPYMIHLETNPRIINDYGTQEKVGAWKSGDIASRSGFYIKAFGSGVIRGTKKRNIRPDIIEFDDLDTDEDCLNADIITKTWNFVTRAAIPTRDISKHTIVRWNGNVIAEDCCVVRAEEFADHVDTINIDVDGVPSWPERDTPESIKRYLSTLPWSSQQTECYNNPYTDGKAFKKVKWGKVPPLHKFPWLVQYGDPATSNKDTGKGNSKSSYKAVVLVGMLDQNYYVIKAHVNQMTNANFIECFYNIEKFVNHRAQLFSYIENNSLQDPFYDQVFRDLFYKKALEYNVMVSIIPDKRVKPDKYTRIEGTLEPPNRLGNLIFNEAEQDDESMKLLVTQLKSVSPRSKTMDGPDALEGAVWITNTRQAYAGGIELFDRPTNNKRF